MTGTTAQERDGHLEIEDLFAGKAAVQACPFAHFDALRAQAGLVWSPTVEAYLVSRYDDVREVLSDPDRFSSKVPFGRVAMRAERDAVAALVEQDPELSELLAGLKPRRIPMLASSDNPAHRRQRKLVQSAFSGKRIAAIEPWICALADRLIDAMGEGDVDIVPALCVPLPVRVIAQMLGVDPQLHGQFKQWSDDFIFAAGSGNADAAALKQALRGQKDLFAYFAQQVEARRAQPRDDLLSAIVEAYRAEDEGFDVDEVMAMITQLLVGGNETTTALIAACLNILAQRPDLANALRADTSLIPSYVEETVRREGPAQANFRVATRDTNVGGYPIQAGKQLMVMYNSGSLDPAAFGNDPLTPEIIAHQRHTSFGFGEHFCIGAPLARLEARIVVGRMLARYGTIELTPGSSAAYVNTYISRALSSLTLRLRHAE